MKNDDFEQFYLQRDVDVSGTSGVGVVARGIILLDGQVLLQWLSQNSSIAIYHNVSDVIKIHGHNGKTRLIMGRPN